MAINQYIEQYLKESQKFSLRSGEHSMDNFNVVELKKMKYYEVDDYSITFEVDHSDKDIFYIYIDGEKTNVILRKMSNEIGTEIYQAQGPGNTIRNNKCPITAVIQVMREIKLI